MKFLSFSIGIDYEEVFIISVIKFLIVSGWSTIKFQYLEHNQALPLGEECLLLSIIIMQAEIFISLKLINVH